MNVDEYSRLHQELADQLDAYLDHELTATEVVRMEAHLSGCMRCQKALRLHRVLKDNLALTPMARAPSRLHDAIQTRLAGEPGNTADGGPIVVPRHRRSLRFWAPWAGWVLAAGLATVALFGRLPRPDSQSSQLPMVQAALDDYRLHLQGFIPPVDGSQLAALAQGLPFVARPWPALRHGLIGAWRTTIRGEPAAAFAYRYDNHILVQYVVSQELFFHQTRVREAVAQHGHYSAIAHEASVLAWPQSDSGSILIGAVDPRLLDALVL